LSRHAPDAERTVEAAGRQAAPVGAEGNRPHSTAAALRGALPPPGCEIPEADHAVCIRTRQGAAVGADRQRVDPDGMAGEGADLAARVRVPHPDGGVTGATHQEVMIPGPGAAEESDGGYPVRMAGE